MTTKSPSDRTWKNTATGRGDGFEAHASYDYGDGTPRIPASLQRNPLGPGWLVTWAGEGLCVSRTRTVAREVLDTCKQRELFTFERDVTPA